MSYKKGWTDHDEIDWGKVDTSAPVPLEPGIYAGTVSEAEPRLTQGRDGKGQKPSIRVVLEVTERWGADEDEEARPRKVFDNFTMTQEGAFKAKNFSEATGVELPASNAFDEIEEFAAELVGTEVWVQIGKRRYEGRDRNEVQYYIEDDEETLDNANAQFDSSNDSSRRRPAKAGSRKKKKGKSSRRRQEEEEPEEDEEEQEEEEEKPKRSAKAKKKGTKKAKKKASRRRASTEEEPEEEEEGDDTDDLDEDEGEEEEEKPQEQQPRRARRRRRAQAEQG